MSSLHIHVTPFYHDSLIFILFKKLCMHFITYFLEQNMIIWQLRQIFLWYRAVILKYTLYFFNFIFFRK